MEREQANQKLERLKFGREFQAKIHEFLKKETKGGGKCNESHRLRS